MSSPESVPADQSSSPGFGGWRLEHTYAALPENLHQSILPTPLETPKLVVLNIPLAAALGLDPDALTESASDLLSGNIPPPGAAPLAQAYAGHQYGNFTTLGDGRAILLGEQIAPDGNRHDIQLKGPGRTRYSLGGDGRAALGPMLREYLISEAMHALGIPTTRSLAVVAPGEALHRQDGPSPGAVLTRTASSHIRVGTPFSMSLPPVTGPRWRPSPATHLRAISRTVPGSETPRSPCSTESWSARQTLLPAG